MKRVLLCIIVVLATAGQALCQNIIIGDKLPSDIHPRRWLMDLQPEPTDYTCILFYHSESPICQQALQAIKPIITQYESLLNLIIITKERYEDAGVSLTEHLDEGVSIAFDEGGRVFRHLEVTFIPFCVICDKKRHALWCGNAATLTAQTIEKILTTK